MKNKLAKLKYMPNNFQIIEEGLLIHNISDKAGREQIIIDDGESFHRILRNSGEYFFCFIYRDISFRALSAVDIFSSRLMSFL